MGSIWDWLAAAGISVVAVRAISRAVNNDGPLLGEGTLEEGDLTEDERMMARLRRVSNLEERITIIRELIHRGTIRPEVHRFALGAVSARCGEDFCVPPRDDEAEVIAVFDALHARVRYVRDPVDHDTYRGAHRTLQLGGGDCDDMTILLSSCLRALGYDVRLRVVQTVEADDWSHIYVLVGTPAEAPAMWSPLDLSVDEPAGWEVDPNKVVKHSDFEV